MSAPLYEGVAADLRSKIADGTYPPGSRLPTESELQERHGVSRQTVRNALNHLRAEGLVISGRGLGWRVPDARPLLWHASRPERNVRTDVSPADAWSDDVRAQGRMPSERISVSIVAADPFVASRLGIDTGDLVVARKRLRYVDDVAAMLADTYYPHDLVAGTDIAKPGDVLPGVWAVMESIGHGWDDRMRVDEIRSRPASREQASIFGVAVGYPVIEHVRIRRTTDGEPVAVAVHVVPGDRVVIRYEEWQ